MPKGSTKLPAQLSALIRNARPLREWARHTTFQPPSGSQPNAIKNTDLNFSKVAFQRRRSHRRQMLAHVQNLHRQLDHAFDSLSLSLPPPHSLPRFWARSIARLHELAVRPMRKPKLPYSKTSPPAPPVPPP